MMSEFCLWIYQNGTNDQQSYLDRLWCLIFRFLNKKKIRHLRRYKFLYYWNSIEGERGKRPKAIVRKEYVIYLGLLIIIILSIGNAMTQNFVCGTLFKSHNYHSNKQLPSTRTTCRQRHFAHPTEYYLRFFFTDVIQEKRSKLCSWQWSDRPGTNKESVNHKFANNDMHVFKNVFYIHNSTVYILDVFEQYVPNRILFSTQI